MAMPTEAVHIVATGWNNGSHRKSGAGYGLKVSLADRNRYFSPKWKTVTVVLAKTRTRVNVAKKSFWGSTCRELISADIGRWLLRVKAAPWPKGKPPRVILEPIGEGVFAARLDNREGPPS